MKRNNWKVICATTLMLWTCFIVPTKSKADACADAQTASTATCTTAQNQVDIAAYTLAANTISGDAQTELGIANTDMATEQAQDAICEATEWGFIGNPNLKNDVGSCIMTQIANDNAAKLAEAKAANNCATDPNPDKCECKAKATLTFTLAQDQATAVNCRSVHMHNYTDSCYPDTVYAQSQSDSDAQADQALSDAKAIATFTQTTVVENNYTFVSCLSAAETAYENCVDVANGKANSASLCYDNASETWNTALLNAYTAWLNAVGAADGTYQHDYPLCAAQQAHDDAVANDLNKYKQGVASDAKKLANDLAQDAYTLSQAQDANQGASDVANCACSYLNPSSDYTLCANAAAANQVLSDKAALVVYNHVIAVAPVVPLGTAYTTWYDASQAANTTYADKKAADARTASSCQTTVSGAFQTIYNAQTVMFTNAQNAAQKAYNDEVNACNGA